MQNFYLAWPWDITFWCKSDSEEHAIYIYSSICSLVISSEQIVIGWMELRLTIRKSWLNVQLAKVHSHAGWKIFLLCATQRKLNLKKVMNCMQFCPTPQHEMQRLILSATSPTPSTSITKVIHTKLGLTWKHYTVVHNVKTISVSHSLFTQEGSQ